MPVNYPDNTQGLFVGAARAVPMGGRIARVFPALAHSTEITFGGTETDGSYSVTLTDEDGGILSAEVVRTGGSPATNTDLATAMAAALEDAQTAASRKDYSFSALGAVVTATRLQTAKTFTTATAAPSPGTLTAAVVADAAGAFVYVGRAMVEAVAGEARIPEAGDTAASLAGFVERVMAELEPNDDSAIDAAAMIKSGQPVALVRKGTIAVSPAVAVSLNDPLFVVVDPTNDPAGSVRNDADGGNAVAWTGGKFMADAAAGEPVEVYLG